MKIVLDDWGTKPTRAHKFDAGLDLYAPKDISICSGVTVINTGVHMEIPEGYVGIVKSRSSMLKKGIIADGTIDSGYTGPINVIMLSLFDKIIKQGERIAQLIIVPCLLPELEIVEHLPETDRGSGGLGSTGK